VALKLQRGQKDPERLGQKQERRGGIETQPPEPGYEILLRKQERRGGIETRIHGGGAE